MRPHPSLSHLDHRPWPLPEEPWGWRQAWRNLAFIHYPIAANQLQPLLPAGLQVQEYDGNAWLGVVPFLMDDVMPGSLPAWRRISTFPELNLRTYVEKDGRPGVWFFSLDASSPILVAGGRYVYGLPYHLAKMRLTAGGDGSFHYTSRRMGRDVGFEATYRPYGEVFLSPPDTFARWATERYCLYSGSDRSGLSRVDVHHAPWPLQEMQVEIVRNDLFRAIGLEAPEGPPVCHYSPGVEVVSWSPERLPAV